MILYYNNRFSFASFSVNVTNEHKTGVFYFKIQALVYLVTPNQETRQRLYAKYLKKNFLILGNESLALAWIFNHTFTI